MNWPAIRDFWDRDLLHTLIAARRNWIWLTYVGLLVVVALASIAVVGPMAIDKVASLDKWLLPDWLISYEAGFVRRGFLGQVILSVGSLFGAPPQLVVLTIYLAAFVALCSLLVLTFAQVRQPAAVIALAFAPFMFPFEARSAPSVLHKETLFLALVAAVALAFALRRPDRKPWAVEAALCVMPMLVLTHEMFFLYSPYILLLAALTSPGPARRARIAALWSISAVCFLASFVFHGDARITASLCLGMARRIGEDGLLDSCLAEGPMQALSQSLQDGWLVLSNEYGREMAQSLPLAVFLVGLAFLPLLPFLNRLQISRPKEMQSIWIWTIAAVVASLVLFPVAVDWGRFIRINAVATGVILAAVVARAQKEGLPGASDSLHRSLGWAGYLVFVATYCASWQLYHLATLIGPGYAGSILAKAFP
jgi:hypothetical protein